MSTEKIQTETSKFFATFDSHKFNKGTELINPSDDIDHVYYLNTGFVRQYAISPEGEELTIHLFAADSFFPMPVILGNVKNKLFFDTFTDCEITKVPKAKFIEFIKSNPEVLMSLTKRILIGLDKLSGRMKNLVFHPAKKRIASTLLFFAKHFGQVVEDGSVILNQKFTHNDIASFTGTSRETATRELNELESNNLIDTSSNTIRLINLESLQKLTK